jgi:lysylphosphatidylglycerol synthase-like protein
LASIATVYLAVQVVRQVPLTPGGIGVIEVSLLAGLVSAGAAQVTAAGAVLAYRLLSCWFIIPAGWLAWALTVADLGTGPGRRRIAQRLCPQAICPLVNVKRPAQGR